MSNIVTENLEPVTTDVLPHLLHASEKLIGEDENDRWRYADHKDTYANMTESSDNEDYGYNEKIQESDSESSDDSSDSNSKKHYSESNNESSAYKFGSNKNRSSGYKSKRDFYNDDEDEDVDDWYRRLDLMRQLGELKQHGVQLSQSYDFDSNIKMMEKEIEIHKNIRSKHNAVSWMGGLMVYMVKGLETFNDSFNPFDISMKGLHKQINGDIDNYYEVLGEIYEKHTSSGKPMNPWFKLGMMLAGATLTSQMGKIGTEEIIKETDKIEKDEDFMASLKAKKANDYKQKLEQDGKAKMDKHIRDRQQLDQAKRAKYAAKTNDFALSSEMNYESQVEIARKEREMRQKNTMNNLRRNATINSQKDRISSNFGKRGVQEYNNINNGTSKFARKANTLRDIMNDSDDSSIQSSSSSISINPNYSKILSNSVSKNKTKNKTKTKSKSDNDTLSSADILSSLSSSNSTYNNVEMISFGTKNKGVDKTITIG